MGERIARLAWTLTSVAGALFAVLNWRDAVLDYRAVRRLPDYRDDGPRGIAARANVRREMLRALTQAIFLVPGIAVLIAPPPPPPPHKTRVLSLICLIGGQLAVVANDFLDRHDRRRAIEAPGFTYRRKRDD
jgi:hypothetical protein